MKRFFHFFLAALFASASLVSCEKDPTVPREVYAMVETKKASGAQSYYFLTIYSSSLATLGGVGVTGAESPTKKTGQTFTAMAGQELKIKGELFNSGGASSTFWSDMTVKVYVDGSVKWSKKFKEGETYTPVFETLVVK